MKKLLYLCVDCVLIVVVFMVGMFAFFDGDKSVVMSANSEYNGTIYAGDKTSSNVSLMVNVYWGTEHLKTMLEIFEKYGVKTTFFVGGAWARDNQELLKSMHDAGHEIANHGNNHKEHGKLSYQNNLTEIQTCHEMVKFILNRDMELFAPPGGSYNGHTTKAAEFLGYKTIMWTRDTIDWRDKDAELIYQRATKNLSGGDLILMHPTEKTATILPKILDEIKRLNLRAVTVSETLGLKAGNDA